jgi:hypothetical protein
VFTKLSNDNLESTITTMISVTISTDNTVIWYDHWEDGFDVDATSKFAPASVSTKVWGDGNATNGCAPKAPTCTHDSDVLKAGTAIVIQNDIPLPRIKTNFAFDGGDRIQASFPIAVTRASYPKEPGSVMAGAGKCMMLVALCTAIDEAHLYQTSMNSRSVRCLFMGDDI